TQAVPRNRHPLRQDRTKFPRCHPPRRRDHLAQLTTRSRAKAEIDTASAPAVVSTFSSAPTPPSGESALKHVRGSRIYAQRRSRNSSGADAVRHIIAMLAL